MAAVFSAPGIKKIEIDQSDVIGATSTSIGAMAGKVVKGPIAKRILCTTDKEFYDTFGTPSSGFAIENTYYAAGEFLKESNQLWFVRTTDGTEVYATAVFFTHSNGASPSTTAITASSTT
jgi:hypothetical protein